MRPAVYYTQDEAPGGFRLFVLWVGPEAQTRCADAFDWLSERAVPVRRADVSLTTIADPATAALFRMVFLAEARRYSTSDRS